MRLVAADASYRYASGIWACRRFSIVLGGGESMALVGPNGAGKTTVAKMLAGIFEPTSGFVALDGTRVSRMPAAERARHVYLCFQQPENELYHTSIRAELNERVRGRPDAERHTYVARAVEILALLGYMESIETHPYDVDPWARKAITLAAALAGDREITILDEPTVRLSWRQKKVIAQLCRARQERGHSLVIVSHDLEFCELACDTVRLVRAGLVEPPLRVADIRGAEAARLGHNIWSSGTYFVREAAERLRGRVRMD